MGYYATALNNKFFIWLKDSDRHYSYLCYIIFSTLLCTRVFLNLSYYDEDKGKQAGKQAGNQALIVFSLLSPQVDGAVTVTAIKTSQESTSQPRLSPSTVVSEGTFMMLRVNAGVSVALKVE